MNILQNWNFSTRRSKSFKGFTLVEILIVILIGSMIMGSVVGLLYTFVYSYEQDLEYTTARQRGQMVFTLLSGPLRQSGLGIPNTSADFQACFSVEADVNSWGGPLNVISGDRAIQVAYAVPSGIANEQEIIFTSGTNTNIDLTSGNVEPKTDWITFPSANAAFLINTPVTSPINVTPKSDGTLPFFDEIHYVSFLEARLENGEFIVEDPVNDETISTVTGIEDVIFDYDPDDGIITASVLARGDTRHDELVTPANVAGWPDNPVADETRHYRVSVHRSRWRVRN